MPSIQRMSPVLVLVPLVRPSLSCLGIFTNPFLRFSRTARPASPSQKRKTPDGRLANCDSVVTSLLTFHLPDLTPPPISPLPPSRSPPPLLPPTLPPHSPPPHRPHI